MAEETVNSIIDNLCTKFGTTLQNLIPEMAKMYIAKYVVVIIILGIISTVMYKLYKKYSKKNEFFDYEFQIILTVSFGIVSTVVLIISIVDLTGWIASPTAEVVEMIMGMVK